MKKLFLLLILINSSCKSQNINSKKSIYEGKYLCDLLDKMDGTDQEKRTLMPTDTFFKAIDSLRESENITMKQYSKFSRDKMLEYGKRVRKIVGKFPSEKQQVKIDSLMKLQIELDNKNTELLIKIVEERGYPNSKNCNCETYPIIFRHSQKKYWSKIRTLIELEHTEKRLDDWQYKLYLNHINGRKH